MPDSLNGEIFNMAFVFSSDFSVGNACYGVCANDKQCGISINENYTPLVFNGAKFLKNFSLSYSQIFHWRYLYEISNQFDLMPGASCEFVWMNGDSLRLSMYAMAKFSLLDCAMDASNVIFTMDPAFSLLFTKKIFDEFSLSLGISSFTMFEYNRFFTPYWTVGFRKDIVGKYFLQVNLVACYIDQFTLSGYLEDFELNVGVGICL